ncbi:type III-A CRISPR-associated RAMP protein Csm3 [Fusobacterium hwasookii]|uniref:CRISPR system Cms endoribonuclease Csm3 n=1 Tax=Fusobacterium hwasookii ChDC F206 TaxID=1307443 RepID=A0AAC9A194_9FUSO|nr:type III-A CRISPR-associated RAMP protein Csm3 [Fusobacterium hwasookii]ALQ35481.1 type III-A CRISPR-associated RAMP protein Csm3 [Fusobacterium hwasookii ChDC F206]ALQ37889.1 type III-A CRISPR-associated RAMP protein Csm3 [Fusobacterium hwasookii ChDC F300]QNE68322.1 type III-A CRISPR-associated RAMP protein Csm3 [Fusobacterium hwasookii]QYR54705.1 type III-A CRISPR-associated RAMP protein Csm3 [Fusobacterium hwasookii]
MYTLKGKLLIKGTIKLITGLHIGTSGDFSAIGAVDTIVIRDSVTNKPMIPGSSLKGKMRYLLSRTKYNSSLELVDIKKEDDCIKRLFGSSEPITISRLQFQDILLSDKSIEDFKEFEFDLPYTEIKYENTIDRTKGVANPRQLERVPAGSEFDFKVVYNVEKIEDFKEDMKNILLMMDVLEDDYLGGHGTRGYGRIKFKNLSLELKTYTEENKKELTTIEEEINNFRKELESKVE